MPGCLNHIQGTENIVLDCLESVRFHQGHMLIGCGMVNHSGSECGEGLPKTLRILDTAKFRVKCQTGVQSPQLLLQVKHRRFRNVIPDDQLWSEPRNLSADFRPDRTRRPGYQNYLVTQGRRDPLMFQIRRGSPQQILHSHIADLSG